MQGLQTSCRTYKNPYKTHYSINVNARQQAFLQHSFFFFTLIFFLGLKNEKYKTLIKEILSFDLSNQVTMNTITEMVDQTEHIVKHATWVDGLTREEIGGDIVKKKLLYQQKN